MFVLDNKAYLLYNGIVRRGRPTYNLVGRKENNMDCMASTIKDTLIMVLEIALRCKDLNELISSLREMIAKA